MATMRPLLREEEIKLLAELKTPRDKLLFQFGCYTGFRIGELVSITIGQVWRSDHGVVHEVTIARRSMKGGKGSLRRRIFSRSVPLHSELRNAIGRYLKSRFGESEPDPTEMLFTSRKGGAIAPSHAWSIFQNAAAVLENSSRVGPHSLRKTFAQDIFRQTRDLVVTQRALGHSDIGTTISYLTPSRAAVDQAILGLAAVRVSSAPTVVAL